MEVHGQTSTSSNRTRRTSAIRETVKEIGVRGFELAASHLGVSSQPAPQSRQEAVNAGNVSESTSPAPAGSNGSSRL